MTSFSATMAAGVTAVSRDDWDRLFPDEAEGWAYYAACEASPLEGFKFSAITVRDAANRVVAAAPVFRVNYRLDTPLQGNALRPVSEWLYRNTPRSQPAGARHRLTNGGSLPPRLRTEPVGR
jgi:hypothetical protein